MQTLLFRLQDGKIRGLAETVESWKQEHKEAMLARDVEALTAASLSSWNETRDVWDRMRSTASQMSLAAPDLEAAGQIALRMLDRTIQLLEEVAGTADRLVRDTGHTIERQEEFPEAIRQAKELREHIASTWPWSNRPVLPLDRKMAEESRAELARGESQDVADILAELGADISSRQG